MWLQGKVSPRYDQLEVLAQVFGVPLEELLGLSFAGLTPEESHIIHQLRRMERTDPNSPEGRASFAVFLGTRQTFPGKGSALPGSSGAEPNNKTKRARQKNKRARVRK